MEMRHGYDHWKCREVSSESSYYGVKEDGNSPNDLLTISLDVCPFWKLYMWTNSHTHDAVENDTCRPVQGHNMSRPKVHSINQNRFFPVEWLQFAQS